MAHGLASAFSNVGGLVLPPGAIFGYACGLVCGSDEAHRPGALVQVDNLLFDSSWFSQVTPQGDNLLHIIASKLPDTAIFWPTVAEAFLSHTEGLLKQKNYEGQTPIDLVWGRQEIIEAVKADIAEAESENDPTVLGCLRDLLEIVTSEEKRAEYAGSMRVMSSHGLGG